MDPDRNANDLELLAALVERVRGNPRFMAHVLSSYQQRTGLDDEALARELGTRPEMIVRLSLCKLPDVKSTSFEDDLRELSNYTLADQRALSQVIRRYGSLDGSIRMPSRRKGALAEWLTAAFTSRVLAFACALAVFLAVGGVLLWRQSVHVQTPPMVSRGPVIDQLSDESSRASLANAPPDPLGQPVGDPSSRRSRSRGLAPGQQLGTKTMSVDLDGLSTLREAGDPAAPGTKTVKLSMSRTSLLLRLPDGVSEGDYSVSIVDAYAKPVYSTTKISSRGNILNATIDSRGIPPGNYRLCVRREGEEMGVPDCLPLLILGSRTGSHKLR